MQVQKKYISLCLSIKRLSKKMVSPFFNVWGFLDDFTKQAKSGFVVQCTRFYFLYAWAIWRIVRWFVPPPRTSYLFFNSERIDVVLRLSFFICVKIIIFKILLKKLLKNLEVSKSRRIFVSTNQANIFSNKS